MIDNSKLIESIKKLEVELRKSGKEETADFFKKTIVTISAVTNGSKLVDLLEQLCSSGAMTQYANFSYAEEVLFDAILEEAKKLLEQMR